MKFSNFEARLNHILASLYFLLKHYFIWSSQSDYGIKKRSLMLRARHGTPLLSSNLWTTTRNKCYVFYILQGIKINFFLCSPPYFLNCNIDFAYILYHKELTHLWPSLCLQTQSFLKSMPDSSRLTMEE